MMRQLRLFITFMIFSFVFTNCYVGIAMADPKDCLKIKREGRKTRFVNGCSYGITVHFCKVELHRGQKCGLNPGRANNHYYTFQKFIKPQANFYRTDLKEIEYAVCEGKVFAGKKRFRSNDEGKYSCGN